MTKDRNQPVGADQVKTEAPKNAPQRPLYSYLCPNPNCRTRNQVYDEDHNVCFNCGGMLFLNRKAREARWYEESGRKKRSSGEVLALFGLGLCLLVLLGIPLLVAGIIEMRLGNLERLKGEEMNQAMGWGRLARSTRHFGGLSGGEYWVERGPEGNDHPEHPAFDMPGWLVPFRRIYYLTWLLALIVALIAF